MIASHALAAMLSLASVADDGPSDAAVRKAVIRATRAYERHDYEEAVQIYASVPPTPDRPAPICFNEGLAFAGLEDRARAAQAFRLADLNASDPSLRAAARFNLARVKFDSAMELAQREPEQAIEELREVARTFRSVLDVDPNDTEAAQNVERARLQIRRIREMLEQQAQEQAENQQQMQNLAQQLQQLAERQREAADQSGRAEEQMEQDSSIGAEASKQAQSAQRPISEETESIMQQTLEMLRRMGEQAPGQTEMSESLGQMAEARQEQSQAEQELSESRPGPAQGDQQNAADLLEQAAESLAQAAGQQEVQGEGGQQGEEQNPGQGNQTGDGQEQDQDTPSESPPREVQRLGRADGDPIARRLLEKEILDRANRIRRGPPIPVERDW